MSIKGSSYAWFRRAIEADNALLAWTSAQEIGRLAHLEDSVALVLCISRSDPRRYKASCDRLLVRLQQAVPLSFDQRERIRLVLAALPSDEQARAAALVDLEQALEGTGLTACARTVGAYRDRLPAGGAGKTNG